MITIPEPSYKRIVIVGGGFAGLRIARRLKDSGYQIVLLDRNNYHQFQPLLYQIASSGLDVSSISYPIRKIFQGHKNFYFRMAEFLSVNPVEKIVSTDIGNLKYDYLVLSAGAQTGYFGMENIRKNSIPMKSVSDALELRNSLLNNFEDLLGASGDDAEGCSNIVISGGGPSGVELAGAIIEMKKNVLPRDYPELDTGRIKIHLIEASGRLLSAMSAHASASAFSFLTGIGVDVMLNTSVKDYDGVHVVTGSGAKIRSNMLIWTAGIAVNRVGGLDSASYSRGGRIVVDACSAVKGYSDIFSIGDMSVMQKDEKSQGDPQVAQVAIQQADNLALNFINIKKNNGLSEFVYKDRGSMATIGRNFAVVDFAGIRFSGLIAWFFWMFVHLMAIVGVKNRIMIFINWFWNYITYDQSLRLIIKMNDQRHVSRQKDISPGSR